MLLFFKATMTVVSETPCLISPDSGHRILCLRQITGRACLGDSGGFGGGSSSGDRMVQYGISSYVFRTKRFPNGTQIRGSCIGELSAYTDVAFYLDWILEKMRNS